jgi:hypothetical protein
MKISAQQLAHIKKLSAGLHEVKIVQIIDKKIGEENDSIQYIDVIFHGSKGFIISSFFNTNEDLEKLILLFRVCNIDTPLQYSLNTCLLTFQMLIIEVGEVTNKFGDIKTEVIGLYSMHPSTELSVPDKIATEHYNKETLFNFKEWDYEFQIDEKYYYLR